MHVYCLTCSQEKLTKNEKSKNKTGKPVSIERTRGVICSDSKDRLDNANLIIFVDHKLKYCRVIISMTKDAAAKKLKNLLFFLVKILIVEFTTCVLIKSVNISAVLYFA